MNVENNELASLMREDLPERFNEFNIIEREYPRVFDVYDNGILPPYEVLIHPSSICNLKCLWCIGQNVNESNNNILPDNLFDENNMMRIIKDILSYEKVGKIKKGNEIIEKKYVVENISFSGIVGEPLMNKRSLLIAIDYINKYGRRAGLFTNGVLMDESTYEVLKDAGYVLVSVDSSNNDTYAKMKSLGEKSDINCFDRVIQNISNLIKYRDEHNGTVDVNVGFVVNQFNYNEIYDLAKTLKKIGVHFFRLKTDIASIMNLSEEKIQIAKLQIERVKKEISDDYFKLICIHRLDKPEDKVRKFDICRISRLYAAIGSDGCMYACNYHPSKDGIKLGDLLTDNFQNIWEHCNKSINCKIGCPLMCDPFKNRANNLLDVVAEKYGLM